MPAQTKTDVTINLWLYMLLVSLNVIQANMLLCAERASVTFNAVQVNPPHDYGYQSIREIT